MALYICPAICDPEPYGIISDIQITPVARHNLMQVEGALIIFFEIIIFRVTFL